VVEVQQALEGVIQRAANIRAGYVYVISNIGSFGHSTPKRRSVRSAAASEYATENSPRSWADAVAAEVSGV
jgi:hypothetical protein